jgi:hemerythrin-like domain-containing protein
MITITEALVAEHSAFCAVFEQMEQALPQVHTLAEIKLLTRLLEGMLVDHSETETDLAYVALDQVLEDRGKLDRLHEDHREIDAHLKRAQAAEQFSEAQRLLHEALSASRAHFRREEWTVFPLIERVLQQTTLKELGQEWLQRYLSPSGSARTAPDLAGNLFG